MSETPKSVGNDGAIFKCPICKKILPGTGITTFPFCSDRCRLLDLNHWLSGGYTLSRPIDPTDNLEELPRSEPSAKPPARLPPEE
jgi:endogenous inhibitor of DNA gyrase (YacG/DUF329 family)